MRMVLCASMVALLAACSGGGSGSGPVEPCSGSSCPTQQAADLVVTTNKPSILSSGAETATITVQAIDANRNVIAGAPVSIQPNNNAVVTPSGTTTNASGVVTAELSTGGDATVRLITVTAISGTVSKTVTVAVSGSQVVGTANPQILAPGESGDVTFVAVDSAGNAVPNALITVDGPTVLSGEQRTDQNGRFVYSYTAPTAPGDYTIVGHALGANRDVPVTVQSSSTNVDPAVGAISVRNITANPSTVRVNTTATSHNSTEVRVQFLGTNEKPIKNMRVYFDLDGDANSVGGTLLSGDNLVYTDDLGYARTTYEPGPKSSGTNKLSIRACYSHTTFVPDATCSKAEGQLRTPVTVTNQGVSLSAFTDYKIIETEGTGTYQIRFTARVVDSAGAPISGVVVQAKPYQPLYYKGYFNVASNPAKGGLSEWVAFPQATCPNEDVNRSGFLDDYNHAAGKDEDANGTGSLEPRAANVTIFPDITAHPNGATTDASGNAYFILDYGKSVAYWSSYEISFSAIVDGTEGFYQLSGAHLPVAAADILNVSVSPPFVQSPWGISGSTTTPVTDPTSSTVYSLCTNPN